ncbi:MAG: hypothetical protein ACREXP_00870 [Steroidobacteraceae bacterium]
MSARVVRRKKLRLHVYLLDLQLALANALVYPLTRGVAATCIPTSARAPSDVLLNASLEPEPDRLTVRIVETCGRLSNEATSAYTLISRYYGVIAHRGGSVEQEEKC